MRTHFRSAMEAAKLSSGSKKARWGLSAIAVAVATGILAVVLPEGALVIALVLPWLAAYLVMTLLRFELAVLLLIYCAPLIPPTMGLELSPSLPLITIQRLLLLSLYAAFVLRIAAQRFVVRLPRISRVLWLTLLLFFGTGVVSSLFTTLPQKSVYRVLASLFDNVGLFVLIASAAVGQRDSKAFARKALLALWASFTTLAFFGVVDTLTGLNPLYVLPAARRGVFVPVYRLGILRGQGLLPHATALSTVAAMGGVLTLLIITWQKSLRRRLALWLVMLLFLWALVATVTRTGWLAFLLGSLVWLFLSGRLRLRTMLVILGILALVAAAGEGTFFVTVMVSGFDITQQTELATLLSRIRWASIVWTNVNTDNVRLLFGFGPGTVEALRDAWRPPDFWAVLTTDYVIRLAEGGLAGLFSFVLLLSVSAAQCRRLVRSADPWLRSLGAFFLVAFAQMALGSITLPIFAWAQTTYIFWILLGILASSRILVSSRILASWGVDKRLGHDSPDPKLCGETIPAGPQ